MALRSENLPMNRLPERPCSWEHSRGTRLGSLHERASLHAQAPHGCLLRESRPLTVTRAVDLAAMRAVGLAAMRAVGLAATRVVGLASRRPWSF